jgi:hypothetical protein
MKVLDLRCRHDHRFEGWFASEDDFADQLGRKLVSCPLCGDVGVSKLPSAPRLNVSHLREPAPAPDSAPQALRAEDSPGTHVNRQALWLQAIRHVLATTEDVGDRFVEQARDMHHGRLDHRPIRGQATPVEAAELREEGIEVMALPIPPALEGPLQ